MGTTEASDDTYCTTGVPVALDELCCEVDAPDVFDQSHRLHAAYARHRLGLLVGGDPYLTRIDHWMADPGAPPLLVTGACGGGKGTVIAHWVQTWHRSHPDDIVFAHYLGASADSADPMRLMQRLWEHLDTATGESVDPPSRHVALVNLADALAERLDTAALWAEEAGATIIIALDGLDKLSSEQDLGWLPCDLAPNVKLLASSLPGDAQQAALERGWRTIEVAPLDQAGKRALISSILQCLGRTLSQPRVGRILGCPLSGLPLFLKTVLSALSACATQEVQDLRLDRCLEAPDMPGLFARVLEHLEEDATEPVVRRALSLIWASRAGLEEGEIIALAEATPVAWAGIRKGLGDALRNQAGRIAFAHEFLRGAVAQRYLRTDDARATVHLQIAARFQTRAPDARQAEELPYQLSCGRAWERLERLLVDLDRLTLLSARGFSELLGYWLQLQEQGRDFEALLCEAFKRRAGEVESWSEADLDLAFLVSHFLSYGRAAGEPSLRLEEALTLACEHHLGPEHPATLASMNSLATALYDRGDLKRAQKLHAHVRQAQGRATLESAQECPLTVAEAVTQLPNLDDPATLVSLAELAATLRDRGDLDEALKLHQRELEVQIPRLGLEHPDTYTSMSELALTLYALGEFDGAQNLQALVLQARKRLLGPDHPHTLGSMSDLALTLSARGDLKGAQQLFEGVLEAQTRLLGPQHPHTLESAGLVAKLKGRLE